MVLPQKREDLCTLFELSLLTPPASPLMRKMVLEYHFDHFSLVFSAALILMSVQSVGTNPLMNVFFWGFTWQHIPTARQRTAGWLQDWVLYFFPHCHMFVFAKNNLSSWDDSWTGHQTHLNSVSYWPDDSSPAHSFLIVKQTMGDLKDLSVILRVEKSELKYAACRNERKYHHFL